MKVLIVDDGIVLRRIFKKFLLRHGIAAEDIEEASDGHIAVASVMESTSGFDLIFMDHMMPTMHGDEATIKIRALEMRRALTPSVIATCSATFSGVFPGANTSLGKPATYNEISRLLNLLSSEPETLRLQQVSIDEKILQEALLDLVDGGSITTALVSTEQASMTYTYSSSHSVMFRFNGLALKQEQNDDKEERYGAAASSTGL